MNSIQTKKLHNIIEHAKANSEYYKGIHGEDICNFPILSKEMLHKNKDKLLTLNQTGIHKKDIKTNMTSGSTGQPITVYWPINDYNRSILPLWRKRYQHHKITPNSKMLSFNGSSIRINSRAQISSYLQYKYHGICLDFSKLVLYSDDLFLEMHKIICQFKPEWFYVKPHILNLLTIMLDKHGLDLPNSIRYIETVGENFSINDRLRMEVKLQIPIANLYGSEEMNGIAYECPCHNMHILNENVYVECMVDNKIVEKEGYAIITNLNNHLMPMIRYAQGDYIKIDKVKCECGCEDEIITEIIGRSNELFKINGKLASSTLLSEIITYVNYELNYPILQYQFHYKNKENELVTQLVIKQEFSLWKDSISDEIQKTIYRIFDTDKIILTFVYNQNLLYETQDKPSLIIISD